MTNKEKIIHSALRQFERYGIKGVTMDDIATELAISKKTIYQLYADKNEIVREVVKRRLQKDMEDFCLLAENCANVVEKLCKISIFLRKKMNSVNPCMFVDLKKFHPDAYQILAEHKEKVVTKNIVEMIKEGQQQALFRTGIDPLIMATMRLEQSQMAFNAELFPPEKFDFGQIQMQLFDHFVHGLVTAKGKELFENYLNHHN